MTDGLVRVRVTHVIDPHNFHAQIGDDYMLREFEERAQELHAWGMEQCLYSAKLGLGTDTRPGVWLVAYSETWGIWVRGQVNFVDTENSEVDVHCVDYGTTELVPLQQVIRDVDVETTTWPPKAQACTLYGVQPIASTGQWITRASNHFRDLVVGETVSGQIMGYDMQGLIELDLLIEDEDGNITNAAELLAHEGLAKLVIPQVEKKVPDFDLSQLRPKPPGAPCPRSPQHHATPTDSLEENLFRTVAGSERAGHTWLPSDQLIGKDYTPNVDHSTVNNLEEELRQMELDTIPDDGIDSPGQHRAAPSGKWWDQAPGGPQAWSPRGRERKENCSPRSGQNHSSPRGQNQSPRGQTHSSRGRTHSPRGRNHSPRGRNHSPSGWNHSPRGRNHSPRGQSPREQFDRLSDRRGEVSQYELGGREHPRSHVRGRGFRQNNCVSPVLAPHWRLPPKIDERENRFCSSYDDGDDVDDDDDDDGKDWLRMSQSETRTSGDHLAGKPYRPAAEAVAPQDRSTRAGEPDERRPRASKDLHQVAAMLRGDEQLTVRSSRQEPRADERGSHAGPVQLENQSESLPRYGPKSASRRLASPERLQSEAVWQREKVAQRVGQILADLTDDTLPEAMAAFHRLLHPGDQRLAQLPAPKELHICVKAIFTYTADHPALTPTATALFASLKDEEFFAESMGEILPALVQSYIRETTSVLLQQQRGAALRLLGSLFAACHDWASCVATPIIECVTGNFEKWCTYRNKPGPAADALHIACLSCLGALLETAGPTLTLHFPDKVTAGFSSLSTKVIDPATPAPLRLQIVHLLVRREVGWDQLYCPPPTTATCGTQCDTQWDTRTDIRSEHKHVQVITAELEAVDEKCGELRLDSSSPRVYCKVRQMLEELDMGELMDIFTDNAIRDSVLDLPFRDLRLLLREVGLKPGYIWEIKRYLDYYEEGAWSLAPSSEDDYSDPELSNFSETQYQQKPQEPSPPGNHTEPLFIAPHRFKLLTPGNFTAGSQAGDASPTDTMCSDSHISDTSARGVDYAGNVSRQGQDYSMGDTQTRDMPSFCGGSPGGEALPQGRFSREPSHNGSTAGNQKEPPRPQATSDNRYYPPHSSLSYQPRQYDYPPPYSSPNAVQRKAEFAQYAVSHVMPSQKMPPARADQDTNWRVKRRPGDAGGGGYIGSDNEENYFT